MKDRKGMIILPLNNKEGLTIFLNDIFEMFLSLIVIFVGLVISYYCLKVTTLLVFIRICGKKISLMPYKEVITSSFYRGAHGHVLEFKNRRCITKENPKGVIKILNVKGTLSHDNFYDIESIYALKFIITSFGKSYGIFDKTILPMSCVMVIGLIIGIGILNWGLKMYFFL